VSAVPVRNQLFPQKRKPAPVSKQRTEAAAAVQTASATTKAFTKVTAINDLGVVVTPRFTKVRPKSTPGDIEFRIEAHQFDDGLWGAEFLYVSRTDSVPLFGNPLNTKTPRFQTLTEAVGDAYDRGLVSIKKEKHRTARTTQWAVKLEALTQWVDNAMVEVRDADDALWGRGLTGMDIFTGMGNLALGFASMGMKFELCCEIDPTAREVAQRNLRPRLMHDDIRTLLATCKAKGIKLKTDLLTMGLLCQAFSPAGLGLGFRDPKLQEAYEASMQVLESVDAKVIIVECAAEFLKNEGGKYADEFIRRVMLRNYRAQHRVLNAACFGVPQMRERSILVFTRMDVDVNPITGYLFPEEHEPTATVDDILDHELPATIPETDITDRKPVPVGRFTKRVKVGHIRGKKHQGYRVYATNAVGPTLTASGGGAARFTEAYKVEGGARPLTPREACRMQGLPEWACHHPLHSHAMRHAGNAVAVPMARELGRQLGQILGKRG
jgi:DNA (cytosine-5)-methyltransferase 1